MNISIILRNGSSCFLLNTNNNFDLWCTYFKSNILRIGKCLKGLNFNKKVFQAESLQVKRVFRTADPYFVTIPRLPKPIWLHIRCVNTTAINQYSARNWPALWDKTDAWNQTEDSLSSLNMSSFNSSLFADENRNPNFGGKAITHYRRISLFLVDWAISLCGQPMTVEKTSVGGCVMGNWAWHLPNYV